MKKKYPFKNLSLIFVAFIILFVASCKKNNSSSTSVPTTASPASIGLYEQDTLIYKVLFVAITKIGTETVNDGLLFDTGSGGMVMDASELLPASNITNSGIKVTGDSLIVNGITVTNQTSTIVYGADSATTFTVYGNLAYAPVTVGDETGNIVIKRVPFFLYYKATDASGNTDPVVGDWDTFGAAEIYGATFPNNVNITSPLSYYDPGMGLTRGYKIAALGTQHFSSEGTFVPGVVTVGLTSSDLSSTSGFIFSQLYFDANYDYYPQIPAKITYGSKTFSTGVVFDTGTNIYGLLEDPTFAGTSQDLPNGVSVTVAPTNGFSFTYTTNTATNETIVENPYSSGGGVSVMGIDFFLNNEYLYDFIDHKLGLKNN